MKVEFGSNRRGPVFDPWGRPMPGAEVVEVEVDGMTLLGALPPAGGLDAMLGWEPLPEKPPSCWGRLVAMVQGEIDRGRCS